MKAMFNCRSANKLLSDLLDGELRWFDSMLVRGHLMMCSKCRVYFDQFKKLYKSDGQVASTDMPSDFDEVISRALESWNPK